MQSTDDMLWFCFGHRSRKAARAVTRAFNQRLKPFGLNISQYVLLGVIARGEHRSIAAMAEEVGVEPSALVRNLRLLEARGLVAGEGGRGRGGRQLAVTPQGADLIEQTIPAWRRAQADLAARLDGDPDETRQALVRLEHAALALERAER